RLLVGLPLLAVDAVGEGGVDDDGDVLGLELLDEGPHRLVELGEAGGVAPFGGDVGSVDDYVVDRHGMPGVREGGGPRSGVALGGGGPPGSPICRDTAGALR